MTGLVKEAQVLYDAKGKKSHVLLPYRKYEQLLELIEDSLDLRAMREVEHEKTIPWEIVKRKLKRH
ncbi:MAG: hypothetical protein AAB269_01960, partial [Bacteroidota bacterium]